MCLSKLRLIVCLLDPDPMHRITVLPTKDETSETTVSKCQNMLIKAEIF